MQKFFHFSNEEQNKKEKEKWPNCPVSQQLNGRDVRQQLVVNWGKTPNNARRDDCYNTVSDLAQI